MLVVEEREKPESQEKNLSEQGENQPFLELKHPITYGARKAIFN